MSRCRPSQSRETAPARYLHPGASVEPLEHRVLLSAAPAAVRPAATRALTLTKVSPASGTAVVVADVNRDGRADLVVAGYGGAYGGNDVAVKLGTGGGFGPAQPYATGRSPSAVAAIDVNGDGRRDLVVTGAADNSVSVLLNKGGGLFAAAVNYSAGRDPIGLAVNDFSGDGKPDLAILNGPANDGSFAGAVSLLLNKGAGTFGKPSSFGIPDSSYLVSLAAADFNGDGRPDLVVGDVTSINASSSAWVLLNKGNASFAAPVHNYVGGSVTSLAVGDLNGDGKVDIAATFSGPFHGPGGVSVLINQGKGTFSPGGDLNSGSAPFPAFPYAISTGDLNGDGRSDLTMIASPNDKPALVTFAGDGKGGFINPTEFALPGYPAALWIGRGTLDAGPILCAVGPGGVYVLR